MTKAKTKKHKKNRVHSSIDLLPKELQENVVYMLIGDGWPSDYKGKKKGKPCYYDIVNYCKQKGYTVSKSAIGRANQRLQAMAKKETTSGTLKIFAPPKIKNNKRFRGYMLDALNRAAEDFVRTREVLEAPRLYPSRNEPLDAGHRADLEAMTEDDIARMREILEDLEVFDL